MKLSTVNMHNLNYFGSALLKQTCMKNNYNCDIKLTELKIIRTYIVAIYKFITRQDNMNNEDWILFF